MPGFVFILYCLLFLVAMLLLRPLFVLLHELAHAAAALRLTAGPVSLYLGHFGRPGRPAGRSRGRLHMRWARNPLRWSTGQTLHHDGSLPLPYHLAIVLAGPAASVLLLLLLVLLGLGLEVPGPVRWLGIAALATAGLLLVQDLLPVAAPIVLPSGLVCYNDGWKLRHLHLLRQFHELYHQATAEYEAGRYERALTQFEYVVAAGVLHDRDVWRYALAAAIDGRYLHRGWGLNQRYLALHAPMTEDLHNAALLRSLLGDPTAEAERQDLAVELNPSDADAYNLRGYRLLETGRYAEAVADFNEALALAPRYAYAYNNRGLARLRLGRTAEALADMRQALALDNLNAYAHRNLGIYYWEQQDAARALLYFDAAHYLAPDTPLLADYRRHAQQALAAG